MASEVAVGRKDPRTLLTVVVYPVTGHVTEPRATVPPSTSFSFLASKNIQQWLTHLPRHAVRVALLDRQRLHLALTPPAGSSRRRRTGPPPAAGCPARRRGPRARPGSGPG